ncbi:MAG: C69 family dipeptidase [Rikenellaceae bacterium]
MKKLIFTVSLLASLVVGVKVSEACTNILVSRGASATGSTMVSYSADSHALYGALYFLPAADYSAGAMRVVREWDTGKVLGEIPEVAHTFSVVGNINEYQLLIGESTFGGRSELRDTTGLIDYGSLIYITLQRCKTAREAVEYMGWLVEEYGYYSSGESISIADPNEVWYLEIIGKGTNMVVNKKTKQSYNANKGAVWVARRLPDGAISAHANQARITTFPLDDPENCLYSSDVISFAREKGWFSGEDADFNFAHTYAPLDFGALRFCEARVWSVFRQVDSSMEQYVDYAMGHNPQNVMPLWVFPHEKLTVKDVAEFMRNHYEDTPMDMTTDLGAGPHAMPYRWRPMRFDYQGKSYLMERAIATQQTGWWYVGECRSWLPNPIGGVLWFGTDDAATSPLTPFYCGITRIPEAYRDGNGHMTQWAESSFWIQNRVTNFTYLRYDHIFPDVKAAMDQFETKCFEEQPAVDMAAQMLYEKNPARAVEFLTDYSSNTATELYNRWVELDKFLLVKYIDGNTKAQNADGSFKDNGQNYDIPASPSTPGYSDAWKKMVVEDAGEKLLITEL